jgi:hypothetical protein
VYVVEASWPRLWGLTMAILFAFWATVAVIVSVTAALTMRPGESAGGAVTSPRPAVPERPAGVPASAMLVESDMQLGDATPPTGTPVRDQHLFYALRCDDGLLTVATTHEVVYAAVDCERYWIPDDVVRPFLGEPARVAVEHGDPVTALFMTIAGGTLQVEADSVWVRTLAD